MGPVGQNLALSLLSSSSTVVHTAAVGTYTLLATGEDGLNGIEGGGCQARTADPLPTTTEEGNTGGGQQI